MEQQDPNDVVRLVTAQNPVHARVVAQVLLEEGIDAKVVGDYLGAGLGDIASMVPEIWVHRNDLEAAQEVLQRTHQAAPEPDPEAES